MKSISALIASIALGLLPTSLLADDIEQAEFTLEVTLPDVNIAIVSSNKEVLNGAAALLKLMTVVEQTGELKPAISETQVFLLASRNVAEGRTLPDSFTDKLQPSVKNAVALLGPSTRSCERAEFPTSDGQRIIVFVIDLEQATEFHMFMCTALALEAPWVLAPSEQTSASGMIADLFLHIQEQSL